MTKEQRQVEILRIKATIGANEHRLAQTTEPLTRAGLERANRYLKEDLERITRES